MANTSMVFNIAKGGVATYARLPAAADTLTWVLLQSSGLEADATLEDYTHMGTGAGGLTNANNLVATFTGYSMIDATGITVTPDNTNNRLDVDCVDPLWTPTTAQSLGKIVLCYDPLGTHVLANMVPIFADAFLVTTPVSGTISYVVASGGFFRAQ
jgi:hypothetical protein